MLSLMERHIPSSQMHEKLFYMLKGERGAADQREVRLRDVRRGAVFHSIASSMYLENSHKNPTK